MKSKHKKYGVIKVPVWITYESHVESVEEDTQGCDGPYSGYREDTWHYELLNVYAFKPTDTYYYEEVAVEAKKVPDNLHVVVVRYSTGDTFSHSNGKGCVAAAYEKYDNAVKAKKLIEGGKWTKYSPWDGYFEHLESVYIKSMPVFKK